MLARTPPMGWNTWNTFGTEIDEKMIRESAEAMADLGYRDAGYEYLVIDDAWQEKQRDPETGRLLANKVRFPGGMRALSDFVHQKGLKFGMYSCCGVRTCADYPGSYDYEYLDAQTFADLGCDYLKYDYCFRPNSVDGQILYRRMALALKATGRDIMFSACNWGQGDSWNWMRSAGAHLYRSTGDIFDNFASYKNILLSQLGHLGCSAPGCFNDVDMLTVGMYGKGKAGEGGSNDAEYRTQFSLWCMCSAPLMMGCDIRSINDGCRRLMTNRTLIRIDQDEEARPPIVLEHPWFADRKVFFKHLSNGEYAFAFTNFSEDGGDIHLYFENLGLPARSGYGFAMTDVFTGEDIGVQSTYMNPYVAPHDTKVYIARLVRL